MHRHGGARIVALVRHRYADFGQTLAREYFRERHGYRHGRKTLRQRMIAAGCGSQSAGLGSVCTS
jgi:hypothetical protein